MERVKSSKENKEYTVIDLEQEAQEVMLPRSNATDREKIEFLTGRCKLARGESVKGYMTRLDDIINTIENQELIQIVARAWNNRVKPYENFLCSTFGMYKERVAQANIGSQILDNYNAQK